MLESGLSIKPWIECCTSCYISHSTCEQKGRMMALNIDRGLFRPRKGGDDLKIIKGVLIIATILFFVLAFCQI